MTKRMTLDEAQLTPFAQMIYDYLLASRPNKLVVDLAHETGINNQTIWDWLRKGTIPRRGTIVELSKKTGMPLDDLLRAAGKPLDSDTLHERRVNKQTLALVARRYEDAMTDLLASHQADFTPEQGELLLRMVREVFPEALLRGDDLAQGGV